jgi:peptidoglycan hydrolase CwlO-like protein
LIPPSPGGACQRPRRRRGALTALALAAVLAALPTIVLRAAPASEVIDGARAQVRALEAELVRLEAEAGGAAAAHAAAQERADAVRERIRQTTAALAEAREAHEVAVARLSDRLVALYVEEPPSFVEVVLSSGGLSDAADTQAALDLVSESDGRIVSALETTKARLARTRAELVGQREEADAALREAGARLAQMEDLLRSRRAVLQQAAATLDRLVAQERRRESAAAARERAAAIDAGGREVEEAVRRRAETGTAPAPSTGAPAAPTPPAAPGGAPSVPGGPSQEVLDRIAACESGGNPRAVSASGQYRGKYQFDPGTWRGVGGTGDPAAASEAEQDMRAAMLYAERGPAPWPVCGYR